MFEIPEYPGYGPRFLSIQGGATVSLIDDDVICKQGSRVTRSEKMAMRLVKKHIPDFPTPELQLSSYSTTRVFGQLCMDVVPGSTLKLSWDGLDNVTKERLCHETWALIAQLRQIPKPSELNHLFQCSADGSPTNDVLIKDLEDPPRPLLDDHAVRTRICERYHHFYGRRFTKELPDMLPRSSVSVFTHGDICPQNIMIDGSNHITGIIDWETAGWYPDYWEYGNIMKPRTEIDWAALMDQTAPQRWDLSGIKAARRVLF
ncbi:uncharacterized protein BP5553_09929 [Venustampulla echinocandica]|uniref:Aminoglycoside phosphotransferase domain-containing protein n=1 Tax=Venustampulla echinocandica TaxID=2656787 RepID=A0A370TB20_9HELO|nr:uncharacterized protein BP5553_09929 [Venustampulla echinocandica]RDL31140.1 hypothetical protein BP5553_09929 [Venustampulla echinocandica]